VHCAEQSSTVRVQQWYRASCSEVLTMQWLHCVVLCMHTVTILRLKHSTYTITRSIHTVQLYDHVIALNTIPNVFLKVYTTVSIQVTHSGKCSRKVLTLTILSPLMLLIPLFIARTLLKVCCAVEPFSGMFREISSCCFMKVSSVASLTALYLAVRALHSSAALAGAFSATSLTIATLLPRCSSAERCRRGGVGGSGLFLLCITRQCSVQHNTSAQLGY
jgi:hypothetical protein